jgi:DNA-binding MarR family transcriptional regulator
MHGCTRATVHDHEGFDGVVRQSNYLAYARWVTESPPIDPAALIEAVRAIARVSRVVNPAAGDLSFADYRLMAIITSGEVRASRLAARLALGKPTISASVDSLCKRGLLERSSVPGDSRGTALSLTEDGVALFEQVEGRMARQLELLCERTPNGAQVIESLGWLGDVLEAAVNDRLARAERLDAAEPPASPPDPASTPDHATPDNA